MNRVVSIVCMCLLLFAEVVDASEPLRRYLLAVGANSGGAGRLALKYAVSDAERFADIMVRMGGVDPADHLVLREPDPQALQGAIAQVAERVSRASLKGRTEFLFYYSGHADETGLLIGSDHVSYGDLRNRIQVIPAIVRITVLDACASGVITRLKGGERRQPFLVDVSSDMEGYAFLTSSSGNEVAQESDALGASFFTHYLISGLRGAADVSADGRVSLMEAYQFAFHETLARTTETRGGAQHPAYQINLSGTGDVIMTDVRKTSAGLVLTEELHGRFYIRDHEEHLIAELYKPRGAQMVLGLDAGHYRIHLEQETELFVASVDLGLEDVVALGGEHFHASARQSTVARGQSGAWPPRPGFLGPLVGRSRLQLLIGKNQSGIGSDTQQSGLVSVRAETDDLILGLGYCRWLREDVSIGLALQVMQGDFQADVGVGVQSHSTGLVSVRIHAQRYLPSALLRTPVRPFLSLGVGALIGSETTSEVFVQVVESTRTMGAFGAELGLGVDFILAHRLMLGTRFDYNLVTDFREPLAGRSNYSGFEFLLSVGWLFGRSLQG